MQPGIKVHRSVVWYQSNPYCLVNCILIHILSNITQHAQWEENYAYIPLYLMVIINYINMQHLWCCNWQSNCNYNYIFRVINYNYNYLPVKNGHYNYFKKCNWLHSITTRFLGRPQPQMYHPVALNQHTWVNRTHKHFVYVLQHSRPHENFEIDFTPKLSYYYYLMKICY